MKNIFFIAAFIFAAATANAQYYITTVAGGGTNTISEGAPATSVQLVPAAYFRDVCMDPAGNLLIANNNKKIYKVSTSGAITTFMGNGSASGNDIPATAAVIPSEVISVCTDPAGNVFYFTPTPMVLRKVNAVTGLVRTYAGDSTNIGPVPLGDGGPATAAKVYTFNMRTDVAGNLYLPQPTGYYLRKIDAATGIINSIAGIGVAGEAGDDGPATAANLSGNQYVATAPDGSVYVSNETGLRKINSAGIISKATGYVTPTYDTDGTHISALKFILIRGLAIDAEGNIYVNDKDPASALSKIWRIDHATGIARIIAGGGHLFTEGIPATGARLMSTYDLEVNADGSILYLIQTHGADGARIRKIYIPPVSVNEVPLSHKVRVYPNPSAGSFTLETGIIAEHEITICDALGRRVYQATSKRADETIDLSAQPAGIYQVSVTYGTHRWTESITIAGK